MIDIRTLDIEHIQTLIDWAADEGWNPGLADAPAFQAADPHGFLGAFVDGRLVAGISVVAYDNHFGFLGLYICHPDFRGRGYGRAVWDAGMAYLGDRTIGLDGVPEQQANYRLMGFEPAYETVRWSGVLPGQPAPRDVRPLAGTAEIGTLERACFPAPRSDFLQRWVAPPHLAAVQERDGHIRAWAVIRPCREGSKIGPLFAEDASAAIVLLDRFSGPVSLDVPETRLGFIDALRQRGFTPGFRTTRMYRGIPPAVDLDRVFAVTSLELG